MPPDLSQYVHVVDPWDHQARGLARFDGKDAAALFWQMRTGKSKTAIDLVARYRERTGCRLLFVLAPNGVHENWIRRELPMHWPPSAGPLDTHFWRSAVANGTKADRKEDAEAIDRLVDLVRDGYEGTVVLALNSEGLISKKVEAVVKRLLRANTKNAPAAAVFDESDDFKRPGSRRSRRARSLARRCGLRIILTGTATPKSPLDAWAQFELLGKGLLGFEKYGDFEDHHAEYEKAFGRGGKSYPRIKGFRNQEELQAKIAALAMVVLRSDCEDLPELVPSTHWVHMTERQAELYDRLRKKFRMEMSHRDVTVLDAAVRTCRLQQILSNRLVGDDGVVEVADPKRNPRLEVLLEGIGRVPGQAVVWCRFTEDVNDVCEALAMELGGGVARFDGRNRKHRMAELAEFQAGARRWLVGQPAAGGRGLDMGAADQVTWYSHTYNFTHRAQAGERASVMGKMCVGVTDLVCAGTVDERALSVLAERGDLMSFFAGAGLREACDWLFGDG